MTPNSRSHLYESWSRRLVFVPLLLGILNLAVWTYATPTFFLSLNRGTTMNPMTSVGLILASLFTLGIRSPRRALQIVGWVCWWLCLLVAALKIAWFWHFTSWRVDWILFSTRLQQPAYVNSRMAPNTCLNLLLHCCALASSRSFFRRRFPNWPLLPLACFAVEGLTGLMAFLIFIYDTRSSAEIGQYLLMSVPASISFICLALSQLLTDQKLGVMPLIFGSGTTGFTIRRLVVGGVLVPVVIGWITQKGQYLGWYDSALSLSTFCVLLVACFLALILWTGGTLQRYEVQQAEHEQEIRLLTSAHFEGIVISSGSIVQHANLQFCQMHGYEPEEVIGQHIGTFVASESQNQVALHIQGQNEATYRAWGLCKDGSQFEVEVTPRFLALRGRPARISVVRDITQQRAVEKLKDEFVSVVSHELRTPVTSIHGSLGLLAGKVAGELPAAAQSLVEVALRNSQRLILLINDILDIQKIESGKLQFKLQEVNLPALIAAAVESNTAYAATLKTRFEFSNQAPDLRVTSDPDRLTQVLTNLLSNAAKFSPLGEVVRVVLSRDETQARIEVCDQGPGIPAEFQDKIFQKFAQADSSSTRAKGGTGLGLSICHAIMERLQGRIGFTTRQNENAGTTFYIELPLS